MLSKARSSKETRRRPPLLEKITRQKTPSAASEIVSTTYLNLLAHDGAEFW